MQRSSELEDLIQKLYRAITDGDVAFIKAVISPSNEALAIGTDPTEWWEGGETIANAFRSQSEEAAGRLRAEGGSPTAYVNGDVGWAHDRFTFVTEDGSRIDARLTGVFVRDEGSWRMVHSHASIGVANSEVLGLELPT